MKTASSQPLTFETERHFTSNALDGPVLRADRYSVLRGSLSHDMELERGTLAIAAQAESRRHDVVTLEDDHAAGASVAFSVALSDTAGLKLLAGLQWLDKGDDLQAGNAVLGLRVRTLKSVAGLEAAFDLGSGFYMAAAATGLAERPGLTRFEDGLLPPIQLDPDRLRLQNVLRLGRKTDRLSWAVAAQTTRMAVERLGSPQVALAFQSHALRLELDWQDDAGAALGAMAGLELLAAESGFGPWLRPTLAVSGRVPIEKIELLARAFARLETDDTDDPLASWQRRGEVEARFRPLENLTFGAGAFAETRDNLLLENRDSRAGLYVEVRMPVGANLEGRARVDVSRRALSIIDQSWSTTDFHLGLAGRL
jgi:hypothetical protein